MSRSSKTLKAIKPHFNFSSRRQRNENNILDQLNTSFCQALRRRTRVLALQGKLRLCADDDIITASLATKKTTIIILIIIINFSVHSLETVRAVLIYHGIVGDN